MRNTSHAVGLITAAMTACCLLAAPTMAAAQSPSVSGGERVRSIHERAASEPFDAQAFAAYLSTLPRDGDYYILEGDIVATEQEVRAHLISLSGSETRAGINPELLVNLRDGRREFYETRADRILPYFIDRATFTETEYQTASLAMQRAARGWEEACPECGVKFRELQAPPVGADARLGFIVRKTNAAGAYIAAAFFPRDVPARRIVRLDQSFFVTSFDPTGVLRHELGHVLGYRHEHIRGIAGCAFEDGRWLPLTPYDPHSVMHYMCGGAGSLSLSITPTDSAGHRSLYGTSTAGSLTAPVASTKSQDAAEMLRRFEEAKSDPFNEQKRRAFLDALPKVGDYYVVEGDLRMTEPEVLAFLIGRGESEESIRVTPELLVNLHAGQPDMYSPAQRRLPYFVDRNTFPTDSAFQAVVKAMAAATADWQALCGTCNISFTPVTTPPGGAQGFIVRHIDTGGAYIASAFFPHDPPARRVIDIDPTFFSSSFDRVGVLRHELGHVLGYRHEHTRGVSGCFRERSNWKPLTDYDPRSVMHYFCGGGGNLKLELTTFDRAGHAKLYGLSSSAGTVLSSETLVVAFQGGEVVDDAADVLTILTTSNLVSTATHVVASGDSLDSIYRERLGLPWHSEAMTRLASQLNKGRDYTKAILQVGEEVQYPAVRFIQTTFGVNADPKAIREIEQRWGYLIVDAKGAAQKTSPPDRVTLREFRLRLPLTAEQIEIADEVKHSVDKLGRKNIVVSIDGRSDAPVLYQSMSYTTPAEFAKAAMSKQLKAGEQAVLLSLLGLDLKSLNGARNCVQAITCPNVLLVDKRVSLHPDLKDAVLGEDVERSPVDRSLVGGDVQTADFVNPWDESSHGTHMAGIIGARDNGFGLVGLDPDARIISWNWDVLRRDKSDVAKRISIEQGNAEGAGPFPIYLFANEGWVADFDDDPEVRKNNDIIGGRFMYEKPLVIASAGTQKPGVRGRAITAAAAMGPAYLGESETVLLVTACDPCAKPNVALLREANFSRTFVHVAAPGGNVLSTAGDAKYAQASGTSQAAAFVAGLASAMVSRYPNQYKQAFQVKMRLQVTATPMELIEPVAAVRREIASGVVDPVAATLDPGKNWMRRNGSNWEQIQNTPGFSWNGNATSLSLEDLTGRPKTIQLHEVWRLMKINDFWMVYQGRRRGPLEKLGPFRLKGQEGAKVLFRLNGEDIKLSNIEDLLLRFPTGGL